MVPRPDAARAPDRGVAVRRIWAVLHCALFCTCRMVVPVGYLCAGRIFHPARLTAPAGRSTRIVMAVTWEHFERYRQKGLDARRAMQWDQARLYLLEAARAMATLAKEAQ